MRFTIIFFTFFLIITPFAFAQNGSHLIEIKRTFGFTVFVQDGKTLNSKQLSAIMMANEEADKEMRIAKINYYISSVLASIGGSMIGLSLGNNIQRNEERDWTATEIGAGVIFLAFYFDSSYFIHTRKAVNIYNNKLKQMGITE